MRASRLLQILLLLQNRGRLTAPALAAELEVDPRTILRDVDAMSQAGLPILTHRGAQGGIELGFNYRTRLTGLAEDEAEALAIWLAAPPAAISRPTKNSGPGFCAGGSTTIEIRQFTIGANGNPIQDFYLREAKGNNNEFRAVAIKGLADPGRGCRL